MKTETDIELCRITNVPAKKKVMYALMKAGIPYAEEWEKVPLVKRRKYHGAREVCIIITHSEQVSSARMVIDQLGSEVADGIVW